jgi:hypothetical protein
MHTLHKQHTDTNYLAYIRIHMYVCMCVCVCIYIYIYIYKLLHKCITHSCVWYAHTNIRAIFFGRWIERQPMKAQGAQAGHTRQAMQREPTSKAWAHRSGPVLHTHAYFHVTCTNVEYGCCNPRGVACAFKLNLFLYVHACTYVLYLHGIHVCHSLWNRISTPVCCNHM